MAGQAQVLALAELEGLHVTVGLRVPLVVVAVVQLLHSLQLVRHHNASVQQLAVEGLDHMAGHTPWLECDGLDCRDAGNCQGGHNFHQRVEGRMVLLACHQEQHQRDHHFE